MPLALIAGGCSDDNDGPDEPATVTITFEDCTFATGKTNNIGANDNGSLAEYESSDAIFFGQDYYTQLAGAFVSSRHKVSTAGNGTPTDCSVATESETPGANSSDKYCYFAWHKYTSGTKGVLPEFKFKDGQERTMVSMMVMNSTQMQQYMQYGFYSQPGLDENQYVSIIATGYDVDGNVTASTEFVIGDRRGGVEKYLTDWTKVDLSMLGSVARIEFSIDSHGWSIPTGLVWSFCADDITFAAPDEQ